MVTTRFVAASGPLAQLMGGNAKLDGTVSSAFTTQLSQPNSLGHLSQEQLFFTISISPNTYELDNYFRKLGG